MTPKIALVKHELTRLIGIESPGLWYSIDQVTMYIISKTFIITLKIFKTSRYKIQNWNIINGADYTFLFYNGLQ